jgi:hypothetical protein
MRGRPPTRKKGAYTAAERMRRYRWRLKRSRPDPKTVAKQQRRAEREAELAAATIKASQTLRAKLYGVLYVAPPLKAMKLPAAKDCVLYLWVPLNQLGNAIDLIWHWGFAPKTGHGNGWNGGGVGYGKPDLGTGLVVRETSHCC